MISFALFKLTLFMAWSLFPAEAQVEEWKEVPCGALYLPKNCMNMSLEALENVQDYERCAPSLLHPTVRDYVWHAAGMEVTFWDNIAAFKRIRTKPKVLGGLWMDSLETTVLGSRISFPVGISPTCLHKLFHPDGEIGMAKGAARAGAIMILNYFSTTSLEDVAAAVPPETQLWMQTYIYPKRDVVVALVRRAEKAGYKAIVVTVDASIAGDIKCRTRQKVYNKLMNDCHFKPPNLLFSERKIDRTLTFDDVKWLVNITKLPVIVKGVLTREDALSAVAVGVSGIIVSNQGGREADGSLATIDALPDIVDAVNSIDPKIEVYMDGGVRSGYDVFKALAVGAKAVFIGRPAIWGLTIGGAEGVEKLLSIIKEEFRLAMVHAGFSNPSQITRSSLIFPTCGYYSDSLRDPAENGCLQKTLSRAGPNLSSRSEPLEDWCPR